MFTLSGVVFVLTRKATCYSVKTYPKCDPPRKRSALRSVREIAPKSPFLCVNRSPIRYGFRAGTKDIRYSVNVAESPCRPANHLVQFL